MRRRWKKSKDYIEGFKHGTKWTMIYLRLSLEKREKLDESVGKAVKSLKGGY